MYYVCIDITYFYGTKIETATKYLRILPSIKAYCFMKPAKKSLVYLGGKVVFEFWPLRQCWAVGPIFPPRYT